MMGRSATDPALSSKIPTFAGLIFKVYDNVGASREYSTRDFNLIPLNPLHVNAFEEKYETMDFPSYHGMPEKAPLGKRVFQNSTGSWDFYYVADGVPHSSWDDYGRNAMDDVRERCGIPDKTEQSIQLYPDWSSREGDWTSTYFRLMRIIQGRECEVRMELGGTVLSTAQTRSYKGRCWISNVKNGNDGRVTLTISYDLQPPADMLS